MLPAAALHALFAVALVAGPAQQPLGQPERPVLAFPCDDDGAIKCSLQQAETVTGSRSLEDMRVISKFVQLVSERNRRYYIAWQTKSPSAAYELVKRVKSFPYLPYGDTYAITGLDIVFNQTTDRVTVRYPKKPKVNPTEPVRESEHAIYSTKLSDFIKSLQKEIEKLKKYEK